MGDNPFNIRAGSDVTDKLITAVKPKCFLTCFCPVNFMYLKLITNCTNSLSKVVIAAPIGPIRGIRRALELRLIITVITLMKGSVSLVQ